MGRKQAAIDRLIAEGDVILERYRREGKLTQAEFRAFSGKSESGSDALMGQVGEITPWHPGSSPAPSSADGQITSDREDSGELQSQRTETIGDDPRLLRAQLGNATSSDYRSTFFRAHPELTGKVVVHHAVEQNALVRFPDILNTAQIHSLENLRGIPNGINPDLHLSKIRKRWNEFYRKNPLPDLEGLLDQASFIDDEFGHLFNPPIR